MKTSYQCYDHRPWRERIPSLAAVIALLFGVLPLLLASAAAFGASSSYSDSILEGPRPGPCAGANTGADYIGGADAYGRYVAPASIGGEAPIQPDSETVFVEVPTGRHGERANVAVEVKGLRAGINAPTACSPRR